jgi:receptor-binding and translocation channel-forming TcA subunit of Tc toxin
VLRADGSTARLGIVKKDFTTEVYFDDTLENGWTPSSYVTGSFPYTMYDDTDVTRQDIMHLVHAGYPRVVFTLGDQQYLIRKASARVHAEWEMVRLSTSLANDLGKILFDDGLETFLSLDTQRKTEAPLAMTITAPASLAGPRSNTKHLDFRGAYGDYYRELFFHVPFRIASHLNANQMFEDAKWWYERIFDPAASESADDAKPADRNWRYIEFRDLTIETMKAILSDDAAIEAYKTDPFNPFAIARLRMTAFQKTIVMKYIDNLLDWGDSLFAQDTMESINEATMLYVLASQILGERPAKLGTCKTVEDSSLTYDKLGPAIAKGSEFLIALENWHTVAASAKVSAQAKPKQQMIEISQVAAHKAHKAKVASKWSAKAASPSKQAPGLGTGVAQHASTLAFCIPANDDLLAYWDRVDDRLFKIRNCMNISGVRRSLALFAPVIDPMALVRAVAGGLSLDEALAALAAPVPPYRFTFLVEKAKQYVGTVQSFGGALLSALEKKDGEELALLRSVHERNILRMTKEVKTRALEEAQYAYQGIVEQQINVQNRIDHYQGLIDTGLTGWEVGEQIARHTTTTLKQMEGIGHMVASIMYLIPQLGSPFAMKFGGKELGDSVSSVNAVVGAAASMSAAMAESTALEATFQRRGEEWAQQVAIAKQEWKQIEQQRLAADIKVKIATQDLAIHETNMEQADELDEFYRTKFTQLGLFEYLSTTLNRLYREAYNVAFDLAKMAERAYQFERDSTDTFIAGDNWQFDRAGLLAGERLILQLDQMEKAFLQHNTRDYEVTQSFSLALIDPRALVALRETGSCEISIPEVLLDMVYPGQYRRLIKAVKVSVPCVVGPYTNVGAKLTLKSSKLRRTPTLDPDALVDLPNQKLTSIAASHGQNDAGMFELTFRDERYLPFENAGAVSTWGLELPAQTRIFDYDTIADVVIHLSYTAKDDGAFKTAVEGQIVDALIDLATTRGLFRLLSLRHELSSAFYRLLNAPDGTQTADFAITAQQFPYFLRDRDLTMTEVTVYLKSTTDTPVDTAGIGLHLNGSAVSGSWTTLAGTTLRAGTFAISGSPIGSWTISSSTNGLDKTAIEDIFVLVKYSM